VSRKTSTIPSSIEVQTATNIHLENFTEPSIDRTDVRAF